MEPIRLQKLFTDSGILSRRAAEEAISAGLVTVNGQVAVLGQKVDPETDVVLFHGKRVEARAADEEHTYILLNKPCGYVTTTSDEHGRPCVTELTTVLGKRVYPVGRLDMNSQGLLLLTDDGELANRLTHPRHEIPKIYHVLIRGRVDEAALATLRAPLVLDGYRIMPVKTEPLSTDARGNTLLQMTLFEGRNRQIRKMCALAGLSILSLTRVAIGNIQLGDLPLGRFRRLTEQEIQYLKGTDQNHA